VRAHRAGPHRRRSIIIPFLHVFVGLCAFMSALVACDRLYHFYVVRRGHSARVRAKCVAQVITLPGTPPHTAWQAFYWKYISTVKPEALFSHTPLPDMATSPHLFPPVVIQLPMFNEREVCRQVIDAACELEWPRGRLLVQVLDDSTDEIARERIQDAVASWREAGVNIVYRWRSNREGYKAGAMSEAMEEIKDYDHCAIFDADFHPDTDFLLKTVPYLIVRLRRHSMPPLCVFVYCLHACMPAAPSAHACARIRAPPAAGQPGRRVRAGALGVRQRLRVAAHARAGDFAQLPHQGTALACAVMRAPACPALASGVSDAMWSMRPALRARCQCEQYARFASGTYCSARVTARPC
jgi:hypothetical protein